MYLATLVDWAWGDWYITLLSLRIIFRPNTFADFEKQAANSCVSWWLCATKAVSTSPVQEHSGLSCSLKLINTEQVWPQSSLYLHSSSRITEGIRKVFKKKNREQCGDKDTWLINFVPNLKWFRDSSFYTDCLPVCQVDTCLTKLSGYLSFRRMFHSASLFIISKAFLKMTYIMKSGIFHWNIFLLYSLQSDHVL